MRKVIMFNLITLDGYFEGPNKWDLAWHQVDDEINDFSIDQLDKAGGLIFGRITYQGMASYWPMPAGLEDDPIVAGKMNSILKYVFSKTLDSVDWSNSQLIKGEAVMELTRIKNEPGKDLLLFGSADLARTFTRNNLIDEYRLMVNPVVLGKGNPLFTEDGGTVKFKLLDTKIFRNGNVLLSYQREVK
jgi:dihydrofolate reductase